jgi:hypothetical protein
VVTAFLLSAAPAAIASIEEATIIVGIGRLASCPLVSEVEGASEYLGRTNENLLLSLCYYK